MEERPLPKRSWKLIVASVLGFAAFTAVVEWLAMRWENDLLVFLPFLVASVVAVCEFRRCPQCRRRLQARRKPLERTEFQVVWDCPHCGIAWVSDLIGDSKYDSH